MSQAFTESVVEHAALAWLESLGWSVKAKSRTLSALRNALLPKLISGELRVKNAEWIVRRIV